MYSSVFLEAALVPVKASSLRWVSVEMLSPSVYCWALINSSSHRNVSCTHRTQCIDPVQILWQDVFRKKHNMQVSYSVFIHLILRYNEAADFIFSFSIARERVSYKVWCFLSHLLMRSSFRNKIRSLWMTRRVYTRKYKACTCTQMHFAAGLKYLQKLVWWQKEEAISKPSLPRQLQDLTRSTKIFYVFSMYELCTCSNLC